MGLYGNLNTMSVGELLAWVDGGGKTGTLEVERDKIVKRITFDEGRVASCSSNDPTTLMGQFLLSSGRITRETLSRALSLQATRQANLGQILLEMGAITQADRDAFVQAKIEETIFGLFDWDDAVFRFYTDALIDPNAVEARVEIEELLHRGSQRSAERKLSGRAINDPRMVLARTGEVPPPELSASRSARRIFDLIDGRKTVAEIVLHSHAPEFLVTKFLTALLQGKVVEVTGLRQAPVDVAEPVGAASDPLPTTASVPVAEPRSAGQDPLDLVPEEAWGQEANGPEDLGSHAVAETPAGEEPVSAPVLEIELPSVAEPPSEGDSFELLPDAAARTPTRSTPPPRAQTPIWIDDLTDLLDVEGRPDEPTPAEAQPGSTPEPAERPNHRGYRLLPQQPAEVSRELEQEINVALQLMASGQPEAALELLNAMAAAHPTDTALRQLVVNAEQDFCKKMLQGELDGSSVPTRGAAVAADDLSPEESFLLEQIDGHTDVQALLWVSPMRDVDALKTLYRMLRKGWLELREAA